MVNRTGLIALTSAAVIACAVACGTSSTVSPDQTCEVHTVTPGYTVDTSFPSTTPTKGR